MKLHACLPHRLGTICSRKMYGLRVGIHDFLPTQDGHYFLQKTPRFKGGNAGLPPYTNWEQFSQ